jgi:hypothetical protein
MTLDRDTGDGAHALLRDEALKAKAADPSATFGYPAHIEETLRALKGGHDIELDGLDNVSRAALAKLPRDLLPSLVSEWERLNLGYPSASIIEEVGRLVQFSVNTSTKKKPNDQGHRERTAPAGAPDLSACEKRFGWKIFLGALLGNLIGKFIPAVLERLREVFRNAAF